MKITMTDDELRVGFMKRFNKVLDNENLQALKCFIKNFKLEHYTDFNELYDAIQISMRDVADELDTCIDEYDAYKILQRRYAGLR